jgi:hypothetical protein
MAIVRKENDIAVDFGHVVNRRIVDDEGEWIERASQVQSRIVEEIKIVNDAFSSNR